MKEYSPIKTSQTIYDFKSGVISEIFIKAKPSICPNCEISPRIESYEILGHMIKCDSCALWSNWHKSIGLAVEAWESQKREILKTNGHIKYRAAHPSCYASPV